jgi:RNA polymerase sigma-70 factor (ECF subfamily)
VKEPEDREELIRSLLAEGRPEDAATEAIRSFGPQILRYLHSVLGNHEDSREAFSQFAENLWRGLPAFRGQAPFRIWAYRIAWNAACDLQKQPWRNRRHRLSTGAASRLADTIATSTGEKMERRRKDLASLRESLSIDDRALAALRIDQGLSWAECAAALSIDGSEVTANTVTKRFERIKERLGKLAKKKGLLDR